MPEIRTLNDLFLEGIAHDKAQALRCISSGEVRSFSHRDLREGVRGISFGLRSLGVTKGVPVAILAENSCKWLMADYAILAAGGVTVPIYSTVPPDYVCDLLFRSHARILIASHPGQLEKAQACLGRLPELTTFVLMEGTLPGALAWDTLLAQGNSWAREHGDDFESAARSIQPEAVATIIFTSGTTGVPKGVPLTHGNIVSNVQATITLFDINDRDTTLTFLPLSHILQRMVDYVFFCCGATLAYVESMETIPRDLRLIRPTIFTAVPRLYEKTFGRIKDEVRKSALKSEIFAWAERMARRAADFRVRCEPLPPVLKAAHALARILVFKKILNGLGGRLRFCVSGAAPLSPALAEFFIGIGVDIYEGYGLTETSPVLAVNTPAGRRIGSVGRPLPCVEIRLEKDGEILAKGPNVFQGYFEDPQSTAVAFTSDGYFKTGDIGTLDEDGFLFITDRKKDILVTAGGKNIAPQPIENRLKAVPGVLHALVLGDRKPYTVALIIPDLAYLSRWAGAHGITAQDPEALVNDERVHAPYATLLEEAYRPLAPYERPKKFALLPLELTVEDGLLTPTQKVRRSVLSRRFASVIDSLYGKDLP